MAGLNTLEKRLEHYQSQVDAWKVRHDEVMERHDVADALGEEADFGVYLFKRLRATETNSYEMARLLCRGYLRWYEQTLALIKEIEQSESEGFPVKNSDELRSVFTDLGCLVDKLNGRIESLDQLIAGNGIQADQFLDEINWSTEAA